MSAASVGAGRPSAKRGALTTASSIGSRSSDTGPGARGSKKIRDRRRRKKRLQRQIGTQSRATPLGSRGRRRASHRPVTDRETRAVEEIRAAFGLQGRARRRSPSASRSRSRAAPHRLASAGCAQERRKAWRTSRSRPQEAKLSRIAADRAHADGLNKHSRRAFAGRDPRLSKIAGDIDKYRRTQFEPRVPAICE